MLKAITRGFDVSEPGCACKLYMQNSDGGIDEILATDCQTLNPFKSAGYEHTDERAGFHAVKTDRCAVNAMVCGRLVVVVGYVIAAGQRLDARRPVKPQS